MRYYLLFISIVLILLSFIQPYFIPKLFAPIPDSFSYSIYYHVPMWFAMILLYFSSFIYSIKYLNSKIINFDIKSTTYATIGTMFGICGIISGMAWAYFDWGKVWINDAKLNGTLYAILCYLAYFVLRGSINSYTKKTILSSSYNILCFFMIIIFVFILPNFDTSIHPKNVIFSAKNINNSIRLVLYSATIGWILFAYSISNILIRIKKLETND